MEHIFLDSDKYSSIEKVLRMNSDIKPHDIVI